MHFHQRAQPVRGRAFTQRTQPFGTDRGCNQQNRVCIGSSRFQNLRFVDYEVLAQDRQRDLFTAQRLTEPEIIRLVGAPRPTVAQGHEAVSKINEELGRGECVCFPVYDSAGLDEPVGWYFVGNTVD